MNKQVKKVLLTILYIPFQLIIQLCFSPIIIVWLACIRAENQAEEDVYITEDNPMLNQDGPAMRNKRNHWWITRFIGFDCLFED
jgi:hypothetical protein